MKRLVYFVVLVLVLISSQSFATYFSEDFSGSTMPANMESNFASGASFDSQNHISFGSEMAQWDAVQNRQYLRTTASDYSSVDFVYDITVTTTGSSAWGGIFIGLGAGGADSGNWGEPTNPKIAITIQPTSWFGDIYGRDNGEVMSVGLEGAIGDGTHRVRMNWDASTQTAFFEIDAYYSGGEFVADYTTGIFTGSDNGFNSTNSHIFVGGGENMIVHAMSVVIPEPTTIALLGLGGIGLLRRKK